MNDVLFLAGSDRVGETVSGLGWNVVSRVLFHFAEII